MEVKYERISKFYFPHLSDNEILSAIAYCKRILEREDVVSKEEFKDICFFFYDNDVSLTEKSLKEIIDMYNQEYMRRRLN
jgi:hypothetical protein